MQGTKKYNNIPGSDLSLYYPKMTKQLPKEKTWPIYDLYCSLDWLFWKMLSEEECRPKFLERLEKHLLPQEPTQEQEDISKEINEALDRIYCPKEEPDISKEEKFHKIMLAIWTLYNRSVTEESSYQYCTTIDWEHCEWEYLNQYDIIEWANKIYWEIAIQYIPQIIKLFWPKKKKLTEYSDSKEIDLIYNIVIKWLSNLEELPCPKFNGSFSASCDLNKVKWAWATVELCKPKVEKINWVLKEEYIKDWDTKTSILNYTIDVENTIKLLIDTVNHQQEQIQQLLSK